jgi:hypothetical protein
MFGILADARHGGSTRLTDRHDAAIHEAAGLPFPMSSDIALKVKQIDLTLFVTEWRDLMTDYVHPNWAPYEKISPLMKPISVWGWEHSKDAFLVRARKLLPAMASDRPLLDRSNHRFGEAS